MGNDNNGWWNLWGWWGESGEDPSADAYGQEWGDEESSDAISVDLMADDTFVEDDLSSPSFVEYSDDYDVPVSQEQPLETDLNGSYSSFVPDPALDLSTFLPAELQAQPDQFFTGDFRYSSGIDAFDSFGIPEATDLEEPDVSDEILSADTVSFDAPPVNLDYLPESGINPEGATDEDTDFSDYLPSFDLAGFTSIFSSFMPGETDADESLDSVVAPTDSPLSWGDAYAMESGELADPDAIAVDLLPDDTFVKDDTYYSNPDGSLNEYDVPLPDYNTDANIASVVTGAGMGNYSPEVDPVDFALGAFGASANFISSLLPSEVPDLQQYNVLRDTAAYQYAHDSWSQIYQSYDQPVDPVTESVSEAFIRGADEGSQRRLIDAEIEERTPHSVGWTPWDQWLGLSEDPTVGYDTFGGAKAAVSNLYQQADSLAYQYLPFSLSDVGNTLQYGMVALGGTADLIYTEPIPGVDVSVFEAGRAVWESGRAIGAPIDEDYGLQPTWEQEPVETSDQLGLDLIPKWFSGWGEKISEYQSARNPLSHMTQEEFDALSPEQKSALNMTSRMVYGEEAFFKALTSDDPGSESRLTQDYQQYIQFVTERDSTIDKIKDDADLAWAEYQKYSSYGPSFAEQADSARQRADDLQRQAYEYQSMSPSEWQDMNLSAVNLLAVGVLDPLDPLSLISRIFDVPTASKSIINAATESRIGVDAAEALDNIAEGLASPGGFGAATPGFWGKFNPFGRPVESSIFQDKTTLDSLITAIAPSFETTAEARRFVQMMASDPDALITGVSAKLFPSLAEQATTSTMEAFGRRFQSGFGFSGAPKAGALSSPIGIVIPELENLLDIAVSGSNLSPVASAGGSLFSDISSALSGSDATAFSHLFPGLSGGLDIVPNSGGAFDAFVGHGTPGAYRLFTFETATNAAGDTSLQFLDAREASDFYDYFRYTTGTLQQDPAARALEYFENAFLSGVPRADAERLANIMVPSSGVDFSKLELNAPGSTAFASEGLIDYGEVAFGAGAIGNKASTGIQPIWDYLASNTPHMSSLKVGLLDADEFIADFRKYAEQGLNALYGVDPLAPPSLWGRATDFLGSLTEPIKRLTVESNLTTNLGWAIRNMINAQTLQDVDELSNFGHVDDMVRDLLARTGGVSPVERIEDILEGVQSSAYGIGQRSIFRDIQGALSQATRGLTGVDFSDMPNPLAWFSEGMSHLATGNTHIGGRIAFGEGANYLRSFFGAQEASRLVGVDSIEDMFAQNLRHLGVPTDVADDLMRVVKEEAYSGNRSSFATAFNDAVDRAAPYLTDAQRVGLRQFSATSMIPHMDDITSGATTAGKAAADFTMLDPSVQYNVQKWIEPFTLYGFFRSQTAINMAKRFLHDPSLLADIGRYYQAVDRINDQEGVPDFLRGSLPLWGGHRINDPLATFLPVDVFSGNDVEEADSWGGGFLNLLEGAGFMVRPEVKAAVQYASGEDVDIDVRSMSPLGRTINDALEATGVGTLGPLFDGAQDEYLAGLKIAELVKQGVWSEEKAKRAMDDLQNGRDTELTRELDSYVAQDRLWLDLSGMFTGFRVTQDYEDEIQIQKDADWYWKLDPKDRKRYLEDHPWVALKWEAGKLYNDPSQSATDAQLEALYASRKDYKKLDSIQFLDEDLAKMLHPDAVYTFGSPFYVTDELRAKYHIPDTSGYDNFELLPGIGRKTESRLYDMGYRYFDELAFADVDDLRKIPGLSSEEAEDMIAYARKQYMKQDDMRSGVDEDPYYKVLEQDDYEDGVSPSDSAGSGSGGSSQSGGNHSGMATDLYDNHYLYALIDPRDGKVMYVGQTNNPERRFSEHLATLEHTDPRHPKAQWLAELYQQGYYPEMQIFESELNATQVNDLEMAWIGFELYGERNAELTNVDVPKPEEWKELLVQQGTSPSRMSDVWDDMLAQGENLTFWDIAEEYFPDRLEREGPPTREESYHDLEFLPGVGRATEKKLYMEGYTHLDDLASASINDLRKLLGMDRDKIAEIINISRGVYGLNAISDSGGPGALTHLPFIGAKTEFYLNAMEIYTPEQLAEANVADFQWIPGMNAEKARITIMEAAYSTGKMSEIDANQFVNEEYADHWGVYLSGDRKVSYNAQGQRVDSLGHVAWSGDEVQTLDEKQLSRTLQIRATGDIGDYVWSWEEAKKEDIEVDPSWDDFEWLAGIGEKSEAKLYEAGITSLSQLVALSPEEVKNLLPHIKEADMTKMFSEATTDAGTTKHREGSETLDMSNIALLPYIGPVTAERMKAAGLHDFADIAAADPERIAKIKGFDLSKAARLIEAAKDAVSDPAGFLAELKAKESAPSENDMTMQDYIALGRAEAGIDKPGFGGFGIIRNAAAVEKADFKKDPARDPVKEYFTAQQQRAQSGGGDLRYGAQSSGGSFFDGFGSVVPVDDSDHHHEDHPELEGDALLMPFEGNYSLAQHFGENAHNYAKFGLAGHEGVDWMLEEGSSILSAAPGIVQAVAENPGGYGTYIIVQHGVGETLYAHLSSVSVAVGDEVTTSTELGLSGNTGNSSGPHLHFGYRPSGERQADDPFKGFVDPLAATYSRDPSQLVDGEYKPPPLVDAPRGAAPAAFGPPGKSIGGPQIVTVGGATGQPAPASAVRNGALDPQALLNAGQAVFAFDRIDGVTEGMAGQLFKAGYSSIQQLGLASVEELTRIPGVSDKTAGNIISVARSMAKIPDPANPFSGAMGSYWGYVVPFQPQIVESHGDDLTVVVGIGRKTADRLNAAGIFSFEQLASLSVMDLSKLPGISSDEARDILLEVAGLSGYELSPQQFVIVNDAIKKEKRGPDPRHGTFVSRDGLVTFIEGPDGSLIRVDSLGHVALNADTGEPVTATYDEVRLMRGRVKTKTGWEVVDIDAAVDARGA